MKKTFFTCLFLASAISSMDALAADEKFTMMDTNNDKVVSIEEFTKAYPQMQDGVFGVIDSNKDNVISLDEWLKFQADHMEAMKNSKGHEGMKGGMPPHGGNNSMSPAGTHPGGNMLIMPPPGE